MNPEDRIRAAFSELRHRVPDQPTRPPHQAGARRLVPALTGIATVAVIGLLAWQILPGERPVTGSSTEPTSVTTPGVESTTSTVGTTTTETTQPIGGEATRYRVDTEKVLADTSDPYLNVRHGPGTANDLLAKLPATYTGLAWTGDQETTADGAVWYRVELLDPVKINPAEPLEGANPTGWVNSAFLVPLPEGLPVTLAELPACTGENTGITEPAGSRPPENVYALESALVAEDCLRIVLTFGAGDAAYDWLSASDEIGPADYLPTIQEIQSRAPYILTLGDIAAVNPTATETPDGVYIVRASDFSVQMWAPLPVTESTVWGLNERGIVVIDLRLDLESIPPAGSGVALIQQPLISNGSISVTGVTRAFEANLGVQVYDGSGPVEAVFSGSTYLGTLRTGTYAVQTLDWTEAWAPFAVQVEGLVPGEYILELNAQGGADDPDTLDIPFEITDTGSPAEPPSERANQVAGALVGFAQGGSAPRLADTVTIRLGNTHTVTRSGADLANRRGWVVEADEFSGYSGPFDILRIIADQPFVKVSDHRVRPRCAAPAIDYWPAATLAYPPVNLDPVGIDSCLQWYGVSLLLGDADGTITEVVLDLWEP